MPGQLVNTRDEDNRVDQPLGVLRIWVSNETSGRNYIYAQKFVDELFMWAHTNAAGGP